MRLGFVCHSVSTVLGGAERCTLEVIEALKSKGAECFCLVPGEGALQRELERRGFPVAVVEYIWWMHDETTWLDRLRRLARNARTLPAAVRRLRDWRCDAVFTSTITVCTGALAAKLLGLPHYWLLYEFGYEDQRLRYDLGEALSLAVMKRCSTKLVAVSRAIEEHYAACLGPEKLALVYFAVDEPSAGPGPAPRDFEGAAGLKCLVAGRLEEGKGQEDAVLALEELARAGVAATLLIAGQGEAYERRLKDVVARGGLEDRVRFLGYRKDVFALMKAADVVLMCSRREALGRVTVEAMYAGRAVVGARGGGTPELIDEGVNGLLYSPGDAKGLAAALRRLAERPGMAAELGANGRRLALRRFSRGRLGDDLWKVLGRA